MANHDSEREAALRKIAILLEEQMTELGLNEEQKNEKTAQLVSFVSDAVDSRLVPRAKQQGLLESVVLQA